jgi:hypothetical protein
VIPAAIDAIIVGILYIYPIRHIEKKTQEHYSKAYGPLVLLGFDIAAFTPVAYQPGRLPGPF